MTSPEGGFYSAEDADSEGKDGKFYVWTHEEIKQVLSPNDAALLELYGFEKEGNFLEEATNERTGANILHLSKTLEKHAELRNKNTEEFRKKIRDIKAQLFSYRKKRIHPQKDDKILTDWNGLMISAFAQSAKVLNNNQYLKTAQKAADFCLSNLRLDSGRLTKRWRKGKSGLPAHLNDYAFLVQGLLDLYEASFKVKYLNAAIELVNLTIIHFEDEREGGFFLTADDGEQLLIRAKEIYDGAIPSGNSVMALNLLRVHKITGKRKYLESAENLFSAFSGFLKENPQGAETLLQALHFALAPAKEIVIAGEQQSEETKQLINEVNKRFLPAKVVLFRPTNIESPEITKLAPFVKNQGLVNGKPAVYICEKQTCKEPETDLKKLANLLNQ